VAVGGNDEVRRLAAPTPFLGPAPQGNRGLLTVSDNIVIIGSPPRASSQRMYPGVRWSVEGRARESARPGAPW